MLLLTMSERMFQDELPEGFSPIHDEESQEERIGKLYAEALDNFEFLADFQSALNSEMSIRRHTWHKNELECVLQWMVKAGVSGRPALDEEYVRLKDDFLAQKEKHE
jgi:CCR4-NOT transcriptional regulation complex NOT5 subunit